MARKNIEKLEELVPALIEEAQKLLDDNDRLTGIVGDLQKQLEKLTASEARLQDQVQRLGPLEKAHRAMVSDHSEIRNRVLHLMQELDNIKLN